MKTDKTMIYLKFNEKLISKDNFKSFNRRTGFPFLSNKFKAFEEHLRWEARSQYRDKVLIGDLQVLLMVYFKDKRHADCQNLPKSLR